MDEETQKDPDLLLAAIQKDEAQRRRGRLKVFLGMAAGAGKTYAMLEAALRRKREGVDVLAGYIETHGRKETEALARQLPTLPRKQVSYRGVVVEEFDLDAVLARRPQLTLVDELAHTNAPGSRHPKRYQDVRELLDAGLDVYTTLNVQHVESRADTVEKISGSRTLETVPDSLLDQAEIELIDISPEDLLARLDEGKIYLPDRAAVAMVNFFREGNLTALREMALRLAAERVGQDVRDYMQAMQISGPWKTGHRLLVGVSPSPHSTQLIRWTRRLADSLDARWLAVYVETTAPLGEEAQGRLTRNLSLARELGAEVITTGDQDVIRGLLRAGRQHNATQIVVGKPVFRGMANYFRSRSFLSRLVRESGDIDIHVVRVEKLESARPTREALPAGAWSWRSYGVALAVISAVAVLNGLLDSLLGYKALALNFLFAVVLLGLVVGRGPVLFAASLSALLWNYFFLPPKFTFYIKSFEDAMMFSTYFVVAVVIGQLVSRLRAQEQSERRREERSTALYLLARDLADATGTDQIVERLVLKIREVYQAGAAVTLTDGGGKLARAAHPAGSLGMSEKELGVAGWVFSHGQAAGRFTDNLPLAEALHLPLAAARETIGVVSVGLPATPPPTVEQRDLLEAFARQAALVLDRQRLQDAAERSRLTTESERLAKTLLDSISHEMRTPIAAISSAVNALGRAADADARTSLTGEIQLAAERLNHLVENLLNATVVDSGHLKPRLEWHDPADVVNSAVRNLERELSRHRLRVEIGRGLPLVRLDFSLMDQVMTNLLLNACVHTPEGSEITVRAEADEREIRFVVADDGPGIPEASLGRIFDKFYRAPGTPAGGTGLGLSIVKGFVEAQGGRVTAANQATGGAVLVVSFPREQQPELPEERA